MTGEASTRTTHSGGSRIPLALQAVFLASNRGKDVVKPPPSKMAHKTFFRSWIFQGFGRKRKGKKSKDNKAAVSKKNSADQLPPVVQFGKDGERKQPETSPELISKDSAAAPKEQPKASPKPKVRDTG